MAAGFQRGEFERAAPHDNSRRIVGVLDLEGGFHHLSTSSSEALRKKAKPPVKGDNAESGARRSTRESDFSGCS